MGCQKKLNWLWKFKFDCINFLLYFHRGLCQLKATDIFFIKRKCIFGIYLWTQVLFAETLNEETKQKTLTAEKVSQMSEDSSEDIRKTSIDLVKKQIELQQAKPLFPLPFDIVSESDLLRYLILWLVLHKKNRNMQNKEFLKYLEFMKVNIQNILLISKSI